MAKKKPFPSQERYHKKKPVVSFRLTREEKRQLEEIAKLDHMSIGQYVRNFLQGVIVERTTDIEITPNSEVHKAIIDYLGEAGWAHTSCYTKRKKRR